MAATATNPSQFRPAYEGLAVEGRYKYFVRGEKRYRCVVRYRLHGGPRIGRRLRRWHRTATASEIYGQCVILRYYSLRSTAEQSGKDNPSIKRVCECVSVCVCARAGALNSTRPEAK